MKSKVHLLICIFAAIWTQVHAFTMPESQRLVVQETIETIMNCGFERAFFLCDSLIRQDSADPMAWMLKVSAIGLHDLDCDSLTDSLQFYAVFRKAEAVAGTYEGKHGESSYSLTIRGYSKVIAAAYSLWQKRYFEGLGFGLDAVSVLKQAKKSDPANNDADCILGLYTYARAELKKKFWWVLFWYSGDKEDGIRRIKSCVKNGRFANTPAALVLAEITVREKRYDECEGDIAALTQRFPKSRFIRWTQIKLYESTKVYREAGDLYQSLADAYDEIPNARRNAVDTRNRAAHMYYLAGEKELARSACDRILLQKQNIQGEFFQRLYRDTEKLLEKVSR
jgi:tetratricopeptide (TPR) repeat protein